MSKKNPGKKKYKTPHPNLNPVNHSLPVSWKVDFDYVEKLDPQAAQWLSDFTAVYYQNRMSKTTAPSFVETDSTWTKEQRVEASLVRNAARRDGYGRAAAVNRLYEPREVESQAVATDFSPTPAYLESPEYKKAREAHRRGPDIDTRYEVEKIAGLVPSPKRLTQIEERAPKTPFVCDVEKVISKESPAKSPAGRKRRRKSSARTRRKVR